MKKGIEVSADYDRDGRWCLNITKARGKLTLDEIKEAARSWEWDFYIMILDCFHDQEGEMQFTEAPVGDCVTLYRTDLFYEEGEH